MLFVSGQGQCSGLEQVIKVSSAKFDTSTTERARTSLGLRSSTSIIKVLLFYMYVLRVTECSIVIKKTRAVFAGVIFHPTIT